MPPPRNLPASPRRSLRGVTSERLDALHAAGCDTRVYLPYGREWFLYLCNRIAEFPPSLFAAIAAAGEA